MTYDELERKPLTESEIQTMKAAAEKSKSGESTADIDTPLKTKEELSNFRPWNVAHPDFYKPKKAEIHIRIDADVLEWYKSQGKGYQTKMNEVLRAYALENA